LPFAEGLPAGVSGVTLAVAAVILADALRELKFVVKLAPTVPFAEAFPAGVSGVTFAVAADTLADA
jgi:hypothetical protein